MMIEVLTRCYKRPQMLRRNQASLNAQTCHKWEQTLMVDRVGIGVAAANARLADVEIKGDYVWILDDDDECIRPTFVAEVIDIICAHTPDVIMVRMDHGPRNVLPDAQQWKTLPLREGHVGCSAYVVRRDVWAAHADAWRSGRYAADFDFINAVMQSDPVVYWHDVIASRVQRISLGEPETA